MADDENVDTRPGSVPAPPAGPADSAQPGGVPPPSSPAAASAEAGYTPAMQVPSGPPGAAPLPPARTYDSASPPPPSGAASQPAPPAAIPGAPIPPVTYGAPESKKRSWITWLLVIGGIVALLIVGIAACVFLLVGSLTAPVDASNEFLADLNAENFAEAMTRTDPGCSGLSADGLAGSFGGANLSYNLSSSSIINSNATVTGTISFDGSPNDVVTLSLREVGDEWLVCNIAVDN